MQHSRLVIRLKHLWYILKHINYRKTCKGSGLKANDIALFTTAKDFDGTFGVASYQPQHTDYRIHTISVKDQLQTETCTSQAKCVQEENKHGVQFSARGITLWEIQNHVIDPKNMGEAALVDPQMCGADFGFILAEHLPDQNNLLWPQYIGFNVNNYAAEASNYKDATYWQVRNWANMLKILDGGDILTTGINWFSGYNRGGGSPTYWQITGPLGYVVGGHSIAVVGYRLNWQGKNWVRCQNSYGASWGYSDNMGGGDFFIEMNYFLQSNMGVFASLDTTEYGK